MEPNRPKILLRLVLAVLPLISLQNISALELRESSAYDLAPHCGFKITNRGVTQPIVMLMLADKEWLAHKKTVTSLGAVPGNLWLKCRVENVSVQKKWRIVSQYAFANNTSVFEISGGKIVELERNQRSIWYRNDAFTIPLESGNSPTRTFLIRFEFDLMKVAYLQIMPESAYESQERREGALFIVFSSLIALAIVFNLILAVTSRSILPALYCLTAITVYQYQMVQLGFGNIFLYPISPEFNGNMVSISAGVALIFYQIFFQNLLRFKEITPRMNRAMNYLAAITLTYVLASAATALPIATLQKIGRVLFLIAMVVVLSAGLLVYRKGYRPAIYSIYGYAVLGACQTYYFLIMSGIIDSGAYAAKLILPLGQLVEYGFFFTTLSLRLGDSAKFGQLRQIAQQAQTDRELAADHRLRLTEQKARTTKAALERLFSEEKVFCDETLSLETLAAKLAISRHALSDLLNKYMQTNFYDLVNRHRIAEAERLITTEPGRKILEVAMAVGFNSKSTFNKEFKRLTGRTPTQARAVR